ncbi:hypothetical protein QJS04_geneDACA009864 [Acorus gramineus]|uniref:Uncharacterized protein n=1 Tax=Acorus gramineus TaxID=55184 RepID=A0AAV9BAD5_ACOGR|nr:hypothetical protein QJS04_geneDACA009864 [Acorus gramineus]
MSGVTTQKIDLRRRMSIPFGDGHKPLVVCDGRNPSQCSSESKNKIPAKTKSAIPLHPGEVDGSPKRDYEMITVYFVVTKEMKGMMKFLSSILEFLLLNGKGWKNT